MAERIATPVHIPITASSEPPTSADSTPFAISNPTNVPKVKVAMKQEIERWLADGVTEAELAQAKQGYLQNEAVERTNDDTLASTLNNTSYVGRTMEHYARIEKSIQALTAADVLKAIR